MSSALANISGIPLSEFRDFLADASGSGDVTKREHQADILRLRAECERELGRLRSRVSSLEAEVEERDRQLRCKDEHTAKVEAAAEKRVSQLTSERGELNGLLADARQETDSLRGQVGSLQSKLNQYQSFLIAEMPKAKRRSYRECLEKVLKKIEHTYPGADLAYFADDAKFADVPIDPRLLAAYADEEPPMSEDATLEQEVEGDEVDGGGDADKTGQ